MFTRIVVPLDGSPFAEEALTPARALASVFGSQLLIVRAQQLPALAGLGDDAIVEDLDEADAYLHDITASLRKDGFAAELLLYVAVPGTGIARAAALDRADLIVMTAHVRWKLSEHVMKSVTLDVLAGSQVPILAWRAGDHELPRRDLPIVVPLDGSPFAEAALPMAEALAKAFDTYLVLVRAVEPQDEQVAMAYLRTVAAQSEAARGTHVTTFVRTGAPLGVIDAVWREHSAALVVIASHGKRPKYKGFLGSVAAGIVEEIEVPVLIAQPSESAPATQDTRSHIAPEHQAP
jgi:nucleotide-binding universal stress UspA family protein